MSTNPDLDSVMFATNSGPWSLRVDEAIRKHLKTLDALVKGKMHRSFQFIQTLSYIKPATKTRYSIRRKCSSKQK